MFALPFLIPLYYGTFAYKSISLIEHVRPSNFEPIADAVLQQFLKAKNIENDFILLQTTRLKAGDSSMAFGTNFFTSLTSRGAAIVVPKSLCDIDKEACRFSIKHEIAHIKNNDLFTMNLVPAIASLVAAIFSVFQMSIIPALLVTISMGGIANVMFRRYCEGRADDFAIANSSIDELKGGLRYFICINVIESEGTTTTTDYAHPSLISRIDKIRNKLHQHNVPPTEFLAINRVNTLLQSMRPQQPPQT